MFPRLERPTDTVPVWRGRLRRGLDVLAALATLGEVSPEGGAAPERGRADRRITADDGPHPHRRPLRAPVHGRRPGAVEPAPQACLTPVRRGRERRVGARPGAR